MESGKTVLLSTLISLGAHFKSSDWRFSCSTEGTAVGAAEADAISSVMKKYFIDEISGPKMTPTKYRRQRSIAIVYDVFWRKSLHKDSQLPPRCATAYGGGLGNARVLQSNVLKRMRNLAQCFYQEVLKQTPLARAG
jgi:hypothetical protein